MVRGKLGIDGERSGSSKGGEDDTRVCRGVAKSDDCGVVAMVCDGARVYCGVASGGGCRTTTMVCFT
ncbi:hypothetical protein VNO78_21865 [Psophocarpus tetragonolobus]|uniref:Uncharacterized protein n=1 Tax=Psophocarpus tetragonolobus TaxID=3891 RepID=A0AAN9SBK6_PSOTE